MLKHLLIWMALLVSFIVMTLMPTWNEILRRSTVGSDFATYYYAVKVAQDGLTPFTLHKGDEISKKQVLQYLNNRGYKRQRALFLTNDKASFQTVARIKTELKKEGLHVGIDSRQISLATKRKRANSHHVLFTLETNDSSIHL